MRIPGPIIEPMTIMVAASQPGLRTSFGDGSVGAGSIKASFGAGRPGHADGRHPSVAALGEGLDVGDGLLDRLAAPGGQGASRGRGSVGWPGARRRRLGVSPSARISGKSRWWTCVAGRRAGRHDHSAQVRLHGVLIAGVEGRSSRPSRRHPRPRPSPVRPSELGQEPRVVLVEQADVVDPVPTHAEPLDAQAEGEAGHLLGVVAHGAEDVRVDHARPAHFNPAVAAVPEHVDLDARLGEREERGAEADLHVAPR